MIGFKTPMYRKFAKLEAERKFLQRKIKTFRKRLDKVMKELKSIIHNM